MESDTPETPSEDIVEPKGRRTKIILAIVIVVVIIVAVFLVYWFFLRPQTPWLFKGAYAEYTGETTISFISVNITMRLEVVDYNSSHAKLLQYVKMETGLTGTEEFQNTTWVDLKETTYEPEGYEFLRSYEDYVYFEGLGTRYCKVYEYNSDGTTITYYIDKEIGWPLKLSMSMTGDLSLDLTLVETNIPGLK